MILINTQNQSKFFKGWTTFDFAWLIIANIAILALSIYTNSSLLSIISAMCGITCTIFISKKMIANYLFGIINSSIYAYLAYQATLYGDCMLNLFYYVPMDIFGCYLWIKAKKKNDDEELDVRKLNLNQLVIWTIGAITGVAIYAYFLNNLGDLHPILDSASTVLAITAMLLMVKRYVEQWYLWIIVNSISIFMWYLTIQNGTGNYATLIQWILYLCNSLFGTFNWVKASKKR